MMISTLDFDNYVGKLCIGRVNQGKIRIGQSVSVVDEGKVIAQAKITKLYTSIGLLRMEVPEVSAGDIVAVAGVLDLTIGQTITDLSYPVSLPKIKVEEPTIKITIGPNTSPLSGKDGKFVTGKQIKERLLKEKETNLGLRIQEDVNGKNFTVAGRGELHLAVLIENMRREGFEMEVSKPQVIYKTIEGVVSEPFEEVTIDVPSEHVGVVTEEMGKRKGEMVNMISEPNNTTRFVYKISSQNLLGIRNSLLTQTRGTGTISTFFLGYFPKLAKMESIRNGVLVATDPGPSTGYGLENAQARGTLFIGAGAAVYEGMVVGVNSRAEDIEINVCKTKKLTNVRNETAEIAIQLTPPITLSLEQCLDFLGDDELLEVTPKILRIRKRYLSLTQRKIMGRRGE